MVNSVGDPNIPPIQPNLIEKKISNDVLALIFSHLGQDKLHSAFLVNKRWQQIIVNFAEHTFANFLTLNLSPEKHEKQQTAVAKLDNNLSILEWKKNISNILITLDDLKITELKVQSRKIIKLKVFDDIFNLARIQKQLNTVATLTDEQNHCARLLNIVTEAVKYRLFDKATEVALTMPLKKYQEFAFSSIFFKLIINKLFGTAFKVAFAQLLSSSMNKELQKLTQQNIILARHLILLLVIRIIFHHVEMQIS